MDRDLAVGKDLQLPGCLGSHPWSCYDNKIRPEILEIPGGDHAVTSVVTLAAEDQHPAGPG